MQNTNESWRTLHPLSAILPPVKKNNGIEYSDLKNLTEHHMKII